MTIDTERPQGQAVDHAKADADLKRIKAATAVADGEPRNAGWYISRVLGAIALIALVFFFFTQSKVRGTVFTVAVAVGGSAALWVGANLLFNEVRERWARFLAIAAGCIGALFGILLHGNRLTLGSGSGFLTWVVGPIVGAAIFVGIGALLARTDDASTRMAIGVGSGAAVGVAVGALIRSEYHPFFRVPELLVGLAIGLAIGAGLAALFKRNMVTGLLIGGAFGWILGAWGGAGLGGGTIVTSIIACLVPGLLVGVAIGQTSNPDYRGRASIDNASRGFIFLAPALVFISIMLVIPAIRTLYLSLLDRDSEEFVGLDNYQTVFTDSDSLDLSNWASMFTSRLTIIGIILLTIAAVVGSRMKKQTGRAVEIGNPTLGPLVAGGLFLSFGIFTALRGTIINNLWWVVGVTVFSTSMGLAVAVLADNKKGERVAKALIFLPMAISLVGASIIWRFVYQARDTSQEQTGILNALWVSLGKMSIGSGIPTLVGAVVLGLIAIVGFVFVARALTKRNYAQSVVPAVIALLFGWFFLKYVGVIGLGLGGFEVRDGALTGDGQVFFPVQNGDNSPAPFNNLYLMIILIWIQTGFAMVILSAAIKAVPTELIEAAKMDGATDSQVFWRVTLPQIGTTIGVVVTTIIVLVMKVYDIVKVTTNGQFDTQVLANDMFQNAFFNGERGIGAALAILILVSVLPVMIGNIRKMQQEN